MSSLVIGLLLANAAQCPRTGHALVVEAVSHRLTLCAQGEASMDYPVAIGSGGIAGRRVGWAQTPLGQFTLQAPRPSKDYHVFIPLQNPDPARFTAWAIGIHGPPRANRADGASNVATDWTWGCIALASDAEVDAIAQWVRTNRVTRADFVRR